MVNKVCNPIRSIALKTELDKLNAEDRGLVLLRYYPHGPRCPAFLGRSTLKIRRVRGGFSAADPAYFQAICAFSAMNMAVYKQLA